MAPLPMRAPRSSRCTAAGSRRQTYGATGLRVAKLANALRSLGVDGDQRVATLMWNNAEHLEAYLAIPSMGAVLHTLNLRLDPQVIGYIADHAGDDVVIVDPTLVPLLAQVLPHAPGHPARHRHRRRRTRPSSCRSPSWSRSAAPCTRTRRCSPASRTPSTGPKWTSGPPRRCATPAARPGHPKGVVYSHRSMHLHSMAVCMNGVFGMSDADRVLPVVPMFHANAWGLPYAAMLSGASLIMPDRFLQPAPLVRLIEAERPTIAGAVPTIWNGLLQHVRAQRRRPVLAPAGAVRRLGGPALAAGGLREGTRRPDPAGLGHDRDVAARQRRAPAGERHRGGSVAVPRHRRAG